MKLLLKENVKHLGHVGDVVEVKDGYGRNYLLPRNLATTVTKSNIQAMEAEKKRRQAIEDGKVGDYKALAERIAATDITLQERTIDGENLYGSVTARDLSAALAEQGLAIDDEKIYVGEQIKSVGIHHAEVRLHREVVADLKVWVVALKEDGEEDVAETPDEEESAASEESSEESAEETPATEDA